MGVWIPGSLIGLRSTAALTESDIEKIRFCWEALGGDPGRLVIHSEAGSRTCYSDTDRKAHIGADIFPGKGVDPNTTMGWQAAVAHELCHLERHDAGRALKSGHLDEAITDLEAYRYTLLKKGMKEELAADALQRLYLLAKEEER